VSSPLTVRLDKGTKLIEVCKIHGRFSYFKKFEDEIDRCVQSEGRKCIFTHQILLLRFGCLLICVRVGVYWGWILKKIDMKSLGWFYNMKGACGIKTLLYMSNIENEYEVWKIKIRIIRTWSMPNLWLQNLTSFID
jgi:hypothetical protein